MNIHNALPERELTKLVAGEERNLEVCLLPTAEVAAVAADTAGRRVGLYLDAKHGDVGLSHGAIRTRLVECDARDHALKWKS